METQEKPMTKDERQKALGGFYGKSEFFVLRPGTSEDIIFLTDMDAWVPILYHRTPKGRIFCPKTKDEFAMCPRCDSDQPRATAFVSIYNMTQKMRQYAAFAGPKKGVLASIVNIFNTVGTYKVVLRAGREGSGTETNYTFVPLMGEVSVPETVVPFTRDELLERAAKTFIERAEGEW